MRRHLHSACHAAHARTCAVHGVQVGKSAPLIHPGSVGSGPTLPVLPRVPPYSPLAPHIPKSASKRPKSAAFQPPQPSFGLQAPLLPQGWGSGDPPLTPAPQSPGQGAPSLMPTSRFWHPKPCCLLPAQLQDPKKKHKTTAPSPLPPSWGLQRCALCQGAPGAPRAVAIPKARDEIPKPRDKIPKAGDNWGLPTALPAPPKPCPIRAGIL